MITYEAQPHVLLSSENLAFSNLRDGTVNAVLRRKQGLILCGVAHDGDQVCQPVVVGLPEVVDAVVLGLTLKLGAEFRETTRIELLRSLEENRESLHVVRVLLNEGFKRLNVVLRL